MGIFKKLQSLVCHDDSSEKRLYQRLISSDYRTNKYHRNDLGENMEVIETLVVNYWKPRYLLNHNTKRAYEFMNEMVRLIGVEDSDIDWNSLKDFPEEYLERAKDRNALFPTFIGDFSNNVAQVSWQLNPDGRYWMDEDGFGMTSDIEYSIYGFIDTRGKIVVPYQDIQHWDQLKDMRSQAERIVNKKR